MKIFHFKNKVEDAIFNFQSNIVRGGRRANTFASVVLTFILRCYVFCKLIKKKNEKNYLKKKNSKYENEKSDITNSLAVKFPRCISKTKAIIYQYFSICRTVPLTYF